MNKLMLVFIAFFFASSAQMNIFSEEPVQHLKVPDVKTIEEAKKIFIGKTKEIKSKKELNVTELHQIHLITYSLEKSVEYFSKNLEGANQKLAKKIAVVVEEVHLNSENNRKEKTQEQLKKYFKLAEKLKATF